MTLLDLVHSLEPCGSLAAALVAIYVTRGASVAA